MQDIKQKNAILEAAKKGAADLEKQLADLKADLQKSEQYIEVGVLFAPPHAGCVVGLVYFNARQKEGRNIWHESREAHVHLCYL